MVLISNPKDNRQINDDLLLWDKMRKDFIDPGGNSQASSISVTKLNLNLPLPDATLSTYSIITNYN